MISIRTIFLQVLALVAFGAQAALAQATPAATAMGQLAPQTTDAYEDHNQSPPRALEFSTIEGFVHDPGKIPYPNASVLLFTEQEHSLVASVKSDRNGRFDFGKIQPGLYRVVAKVGNLCPANIPVKVSSFALGHRRLQITMQPGGLDTCSYGTMK